jgi:hypothetical protein
MLIKIALIICVICTLNGSTALTITEDIATNGGGKLTCRTTTPLAEDQVEASGIQEYSLSVKQDTEKGTASLTSKYSLNIPHNVSQKRRTANVSPSNEINNASLNATSVSITQTIINIGNTAPIDNTIANNLGENAIQKGNSRIKAPVENLKSDLLENASINKNNAVTSNHLPIYPGSFRIKNSSTGKFDTPYKILEDHISGDSSQNRYGIKMIFPNHLMHGAEVSGADNFTAENRISFERGRVTTDYKMKGKGILEGSVMASGKLGRLNPVTRTKIEDSNFTIHSGVEDEAKLGYNSDIDKLSNDVEEPEVGSEEKQNESNKVEYYGLLDSLTKSSANGAINWPVKTLGTGPNEPLPLYWFTWENIPDDKGNSGDNVTFITRLTDNLTYTWAGCDGVKPEKPNDTSISVKGDGKIIILTFSGNKLSLNDGSKTKDEFIVTNNSTKNGTVHQIYIPIKYDEYNPARPPYSCTQSNPVAASKESAKTESSSQSNPVTASKESVKTDSSSQLRLGAASKASGLTAPVISGPIFGSPVNSTFIDRTITNSNYNTKTVYIGRYKPPEDTDIKDFTEDYSMNISGGIYTFENRTDKGPKQKYLNIRYGDSRIKFRYTPPGATFDIYKGPI